MSAKIELGAGILRSTSRKCVCRDSRVRAHLKMPAMRSCTREALLLAASCIIEGLTINKSLNTQIYIIIDTHTKVHNELTIREIITSRRRERGHERVVARLQIEEQLPRLLFT